MSFQTSDFHARYSAIGKTYVYKIYNGIERNVFNAHYTYHYPYHVEDDLIKEAASYLVGEHNFTSFMASGSSAQNPVRIIHNISFSRKGEMIEITYTGNGFLYKMVRIITGFLLEVGQRKIKPKKTVDLLVNPTRKFTSKVAPATGLYLLEV
jgi:tRNA pseudouridine38-40 synthase